MLTMEMIQDIGVFCQNVLMMVAVGLEILTQLSA
jgi:hypothetical protein